MITDVRVEWKEGGRARAMAQVSGHVAAIRALAVTVSNRAAAGVFARRSGPVLAKLLLSAGCAVDGPLVVPDGEPVEAALRDALAAPTTSSSPPAAPGSPRPT